MEKNENEVSEKVMAGFARKSVGGGSINLSINKKTVNELSVYTGKDGTEYINLMLNIKGIMELIDGTGRADYTSIVHFPPKKA